MTPTTGAADLSAQGRALTLFTNRLATLVEAGLPVSRALEVMGDVAEPFGSASGALSHHLMTTLGDGSSPNLDAEEMQKQMYINWLYNRDMYPTLVKHISDAIEQERYLLPSRSQGLAKALKGRPDLFSAYYSEVVYHGDNGGQLDATLRRLADLLEKQQQLAYASPEGEKPLFLFLPCSSPVAADWSSLSAYQRRSTLILLLRGLATALSCGVPIVRAMRLTAVVLPEAFVTHWLEAVQDILKGDPIVTSLRRMEILPEYAIQLVSIGEELGTLDSTLVRAAELIEDEK